MNSITFKLRHHKKKKNKTEDGRRYLQHITNKGSYLKIHIQDLYIAEKDKPNLKLNRRE